MATYLDVLLKENSPAGLPNVFFIGPYGNRVSFASQQKRALNTIIALQGKKLPNLDELKSARRPKMPRIAVLGAGLAGVTATIALLDLGFAVDLFEKNERALQKQEHADHRYIHPTINFWPKVDLVPRTDLPLLNWIEGECQNVIRNLSNQWEEVKRVRDGVTLNFHGNAEVKRLRDDGTKEAALIDYRSLDVDATLGPFDIVFVTTGFGEDVVLSAASLDPPERFPYWSPDGLKRFNTTDQKVTVVGTGDGGLIDFFRLLLPDFDSGEMCLDLIRAIERIPNLKDQIAAVDEGIKDGEHKDVDSNDSAEAYFTAYSGLLETTKLSHIIRTYLPYHKKRRGMEASLYFENRLQYVQLIGRFSHPYDHNTAVIHKILLTQILKDHWREYPELYRQVVYSPDDRAIDVGGVRVPVTGAIVERLGARPPMKDLMLEIGKSENDAKLSAMPDRAAAEGLRQAFATQKLAEFEKMRARQSVIADMIEVEEHHIAKLSVTLKELNPFEPRYDQSHPVYIRNFKFDLLGYLNRDRNFAGNAESWFEINEDGRPTIYWHVKEEDLRDLHGDDYPQFLNGMVPNTMNGVAVTFKTIRTGKDIRK